MASPRRTRHDRGVSNVVNLNKFRKARAKAERELEARQKARLERCVDGARLTLISGALTMMARQLRVVLGALTPRPRLEAVRWFSPTLDRGWSWNAAEEPLAMHGTAFDAE